jgi:hypothetical protein
VGGGTFAKPGIVVLTAKELNIVVILVKVEVQIAAALGTFQKAGERAPFLGNAGTLAPGVLHQRLHLFPSGPVNDCLMHIEEDRPIFLGVLNPFFHLVGFGVAFEIDHIATVFLQGEDFLNGGVAPLGRLQRTFGAAPVGTFASPVVGGIYNPVRTQRGGNFGKAEAILKKFKK